MYKHYFKTYHDVETFLLSISIILMLIVLTTGLITFNNTGTFPVSAIYSMFILLFFFFAVAYFFYKERKKIINVVKGLIKPVYEINPLNNISFDSDIIILDKVKYVPYKLSLDINGEPALYKTLSKPNFLIKYGYQNIIVTIFNNDTKLFNQTINSHIINLQK